MSKPSQNPPGYLGLTIAAFALFGGARHVGFAQSPVAYWDFEDGVGQLLGEGTSNVSGADGSVRQVSSGAARGQGCLEIRSDGSSTGFLEYAGSPLGSPPAYTLTTWFRFADLEADGSRDTVSLFEVVSGDDRVAKVWMRPFGDSKVLCTWAGGEFEWHQDYELHAGVADGEWHHFASVYDRSAQVMRHYVDGDRVGLEQLAENAGAVRVMSGLIFGDTRARDGGQNWDGCIDDFAIYAAALTGNQIAALASGDASPTGLPEPVAEPPLPEAVPYTEGAWRFAVLPDLQKYGWRDGSNMPVLHEVMDWLVAQRDPLQIGFVGTVGDLTAKNLTVHWDRLRPAFARLDGQLPYVLCLGNHDTGANGWARERETMPVNDYFDLGDNAKIDPAQGGTFREAFAYGEDGDPCFESTAHEYLAPDGTKWLLISLEFSPRQAVVDWAAEVCDRPEYREHIAVLFVHSYLYENDAIYSWPEKNDENGIQFGNPHGTGLAAFDDDVHDGSELWAELVSEKRQFRMVFCGSVSASDGVGYRMTRNAYGDRVHQMLFDPEWRYRGGNGFIRMLEVLPGAATARVRSFSPFLDGQGMFPWITTPDCQFEIGLDPVFADYEGWAGAAGLAGAEALASTDVEGDGLSNLLEFALGGDPWRSDPQRIALQPNADGSFDLRFPMRRRVGEMGIEFDIEGSSRINGGWQVVDAEITPLEEFDLPELAPQAEWLVARELRGDERGFFRLRLRLPVAVP